MHFRTKEIYKVQCPIGLGKSDFKKHADALEVFLGKDVEKDKERAIELLTLAAENGNEYAQYILDHIDDIKEVPLSMMTTRMFRHIGRIIENELPIRNTILTGVEHKLKQKLIRKRGATGHREDDHSLRF